MDFKRAGQTYGIIYLVALFFAQFPQGFLVFCFSPLTLNSQSFALLLLLLLRLWLLDAWWAGRSAQATERRGRRIVRWAGICWLLWRIESCSWACGLRAVVCRREGSCWKRGRHGPGRLCGSPSWRGRDGSSADDPYRAPRSPLQRFSVSKMKGREVLDKVSGSLRCAWEVYCTVGQVEIYCLEIQQVK